MPSANRSERRPARVLTWMFLAALVLLHQDFWLRDDPALVLGSFPASLAHHVACTALATLGWLLVTRFAWPDELDEI